MINKYDLDEYEEGMHTYGASDSILGYLIDEYRMLMAEYDKVCDENIELRKKLENSNGMQKAP